MKYEFRAPNASDIQFTTVTEPSWHDGFAEGYSRGWVECWEYMREIANSEQQTPTPAKGSDDASR